MNLLSVEDISKSYGEKVLFKSISFGVNKGQKIALIAKNGTGKTSILDIIVGKDNPDTGNVIFRKGTQIAYLPQEPNLNPRLTVEETILSSDNPTLRVIAQYDKAIENPDDQEAYQKAFEAMDLSQAWDYEKQYKKILFKLKLNDLNAKVGSLSGGQIKRLALCNALLQDPELLILDEPTNHIDLEMIEWLEDYFSKEKITLLMVTHDRYFLERVCNEIIELDNGKLYTYKGNYSYYLEKREARIAQEDVEAHKNKLHYKKELEWMRKQPKARTTKSKSRIEDYKKIKEKASERRNEHLVQLEINMERLGSKMIEMHKVQKSFGEKIILNHFNYSFQRSERIGIIGKNGTGKSTFLNLLTSNEKIDSGKIIWGETLKFGYYTQKGINIKQGQKVIDVIKDYGDYIPLKKGRKISAQQLLERFLFDRKKQYDFVNKLSGGELKRLYLCTVLIQNPNFLIVDHLFVFKGDGNVENFPGNYSDYRVYEDSKEQENKESLKIYKKDKKVLTGDINKTVFSYKQQKEFRKLELDIKKIEIKKKEIQNRFTQEELTSKEIEEISIELGLLEKELEIKTLKWFELSEISE